MTAIRARLGRLGLRTRLGVAVALAALVTVSVAFAIVYRDTYTRANGELNKSVKTNADTFARVIGGFALRRRGREVNSVDQVLARAQSYASAQPFGSTAQLLFVVIPGVGRASNHQELFGGSSPGDTETEAEQRIENAEGRVLQRPVTGLRTLTAPDAGTVRVYETAIDVDGHRAYFAAGALTAPVEATQHEVLESFVLAGSLAVLVAVGSAMLIGGWISAPLRRIAGVATRIDGGDLTPRLQISDDAGPELQTLVDSFNRMLDRLEAAFSRQREFVADASHELRTPLTVIRGQLELLDTTHGATPDTDEIDRLQRVLQAEIARLTRLVDDLLLLAQTDRVGFLHLESVRLPEFITELWEGLSLIADRHYVIGAIPDVEIRADPDRLAQALRNLAANAVAHTDGPDGLVAVEARELPGGRIRIAVSDDGPGVPPRERELIFDRFHRTDPARTRAAGGAGLGLAIVRAIVTAHRGTIQVGDRAGGGARFELDLPLAATSGRSI